MGEQIFMSLHGNSAKQRALSKKRVGAKLCELSSSRNLRKFLLMSEILSLNSKDKSAEYFKDEQNLYKEEVLYDFRILSENKSLKVQLC